MVWFNIESAPTDGTKFLTVLNNEIFIVWWETEVYGGPGWFSGDYADNWGDRAIFYTLEKWTPLPDIDNAMQIDETYEILLNKERKEILRYKLEVKSQQNSLDAANDYIYKLQTALYEIEDKSIDHVAVRLARNAIMKD